MSGQKLFVFGQIIEDDCEQGVLRSFGMVFVTALSLMLVASIYNGRQGVIYGREQIIMGMMDGSGQLFA